ncbi:hypothetical protein cyc_04228 [Cyclospora cayetanensis]|uniref:Uncharacterized protein n=1 Tax=Cyclospora cayetanensis TaxID=88456 RepID=A0A1D3D852_9EIME|nr:hypothetical protein cyc_04228 [Cyclospora cayetanensis]
MSALFPRVTRLGPLMRYSGALRTAVRPFASYQGQKVTSDQLLKKNDDWLIEETNFCLGRVAPIRFKETDDFAHRVLHLMDAQLGKMHTRLRDGTCIPVMGLYIPCIMDKPTPLHQCLVNSNYISPCVPHMCLTPLCNADFVEWLMAGQDLPCSALFLPETPLLKYTWDETYTEAYDN